MNKDNQLLKNRQTKHQHDKKKTDPRHTKSLNDKWK